MIDSFRLQMERLAVLGFVTHDEPMHGSAPGHQPSVCGRNSTACVSRHLGVGSTMRGRPACQSQSSDKATSVLRRQAPDDAAIFPMWKISVQLSD
jgi:hypothetical protein